jgi:hypothetical protein
MDPLIKYNPIRVVFNAVSRVNFRAFFSYSKADFPAFLDRFSADFRARFVIFFLA